MKTTIMKPTRHMTASVLPACLLLLLATGCATHNQPAKTITVAEPAPDAPRTIPVQASATATGEITESAIPLDETNAAALPAVPDAEKQEIAQKISASALTGKKMDRPEQPDPTRSATRKAEKSRLSAPLKSSFDTGPRPEGVQEKDGGLVLNFDQASLSDVIMVFAELLDINYMPVAPLIGEVTIQTSGVLDKNDLFPLFYQILEANNLTAVKEGDLYKIVDMKEVSRVLSDVRTDSADTIPPGERGLQIQIVPLQHINPEEMVKILTPFISANGSIIAHDASRTLLIVDHRTNLVKAMRLIDTFDVDLFDSVRHRFFPLRHVVGKDIVGPLTKLADLYTKNSGEEVQVFELEKMNSLLVLTGSDRMMDKIAELIGELDTPSADVEPHIYIYFLKNSQAGEMASLLGSVFTARQKEEEQTLKLEKTTEQPPAKGEANPFTQNREPAPKPVTTKTTGTDYGAGTLRGDIRITQDEIRNALIIEAIPSDYHIVEKVLSRLDILPRQVLISVSVVEVQLDDDMEMGVEWSWTKINNMDKETPSFWSASTGSDGLSYAIGQLDKWNATLTALAQKKKVNILSSPSVLASDNKEAKIDIATEVPVASAQIQYDDATSNKTQTDIQYRNTGVLLGVTPHINEYGLVSMEINQEISEQSGAVSVGGESYPSFFKRSVSTNLTVNNGQTIVIGGLIRENATRSSTGVPFLSDIPGLGWLFGKQGDNLSKSELIIFITPRVVANLADVDAVTSEFARKAGYELKK